jgi:hypothetical protein
LWFPNLPDVGKMCDRRSQGPDFFALTCLWVGESYRGDTRCNRLTHSMAMSKKAP